MEPQPEPKQEADTSRKPRVFFKRKQLVILEGEFAKSEYISRDNRKKLADELGISSDRIKVWFQNQRMRKRKKEKELMKSLEKDAQYMHKLCDCGLSGKLNAAVNGSYYNGTYGSSAVPNQQLNIPLPDSCSQSSHLQQVRSSSTRSVLQNCKNNNIWNCPHETWQPPFENQSLTYNHHNTNSIVASDNFTTNSLLKLQSTVHASTPDFDHFPETNNFRSANNISSNEENYPSVVFSTGSTNTSSSEDLSKSGDFHACRSKQSSSASLDNKICNMKSSVEDFNSNNGHQANNCVNPMNNYNYNSTTNSHFENGNTNPFHQSAMPQYHPLNTNTYPTHPSMQPGSLWCERIQPAKQQTTPCMIKGKQKPFFDDTKLNNSAEFIDYQNAYAFHGQTHNHSQDFQSHIMHQHQNFENRSFKASYSTVPQCPPISSGSKNFYPGSQPSKLPNSQNFPQNEAGSSGESFIHSNAVPVNGRFIHNNVEILNPQYCHENKSEFIYLQFQQCHPESFHTQYLQNNV